MQVILDTNARATGPLSNLEIGYNVFRMFTGVNLFFHGFTRIWAGLGPWAATEAETFTDTMFPVALAHLFLQVLPYVQVVVGTCIALGLFTRVVVMHYAIYYWILLALLNLNRVSVDSRRAGSS
jgi:thiosulfate dehydrogenase [quinone] large subunit